MASKKVIIEKADRLYQLPPEPTKFLPEHRRRSLIRKMEVLDLAGFDWPVPFEASHSLKPTDLAPASSESIAALKEELANWYHQHLHVKLLPEKEIFIGHSTTNLLYSLALAFVDHGDIVFVPEVGIPLYRRVTVACGAEPVAYSVTGKDGWMPDFERVNTRLGRVAKILFLNSPHNPTGAELGEKDMTSLAFQAGRDNIIVVNDAAYMTVSGRKPVSLLAATGGKKIGVEVGSFSYLFGLPRLPIGFVVGNRDIINGLKQAARLTPMTVNEYLTRRAISAVQRFPNENLKGARTHIASSRAEAVKLLDLLELEPTGYDTVPFVWGRIERRRGSAFAAGQMFRSGRIMAIPGVAFGESGEGFLRFSLTAAPDTYTKALERVRKKPRLFKLVKER